jgi:hypothetical protein
MSQTYIKLFYGTAIDVNKLCGALATIGVNPIVKDLAESARLAGFGTLFSDQEVWVHTDEFEKSRSIMEDLLL